MTRNTSGLWTPRLSICSATMRWRCKIIGSPAALYGSGRTDAGVHALNQVANFKTDSRIPCDNFLAALNNLLPPAVRIRKAEEVPEDFHARYGAKSKTYRYRILFAPLASPFMARFVYHYPHPLDINSMSAAARQFEGEHDFTSFAASPTAGIRDLGSVVRDQVNPDSLETPNTEPRNPGPSMVRTIFSSRVLWRPKTSILIYEVKSNGFLHHMVRNIVGTLIEVGRGRLQPSDIRGIIAARDRSLAGPTAPASGLCLVTVDYGSAG